ncbi:hypothetical protein ACFYW8_37925 [Streptomyces sp. NPDC002742]|uniref:hypothetical protein n=1 Tax=Streptomyces sp. NPDC002742 TaxID=3364663 RepID=UPI003691A3A1
MQWPDPPERFGPRKTVHERYRLWSADGTWERLLQQVNQSPRDPLPVRRRIAQRFSGAVTPEVWVIETCRSPSAAAHRPGGRPELRRARETGELPGRGQCPCRYRHRPNTGSTLVHKWRVNAAHGGRSVTVSSHRRQREAAGGSRRTRIQSVFWPPPGAPHVKITIPAHV